MSLGNRRFHLLENRTNENRRYLKFLIHRDALASQQIFKSGDESSRKSFVIRTSDTLLHISSEIEKLYLGERQANQDNLANKSFLKIKGRCHPQNGFFILRIS